MVVRHLAYLIRHSRKAMGKSERTSHASSGWPLLFLAILQQPLNNKKGKFMEWLLIIIAVIFILAITSVVDIYLRVGNLNALTDLNTIRINAVNQILAKKGILQADMVDEIMKDIVNKMPAKDVSLLGKRLAKLGIWLFDSNFKPIIKDNNIKK